MQISGVLLRRLAEMICGDPPYDENVPYRSSGALTSFFDDLWLGFRHDGSTRRFWVEGVLRQLAGESSGGEVELTPELSKVIAHIVNPLHYQGSDGDHEGAIGQLNEVLSFNGLAVLYDKPSGTAYTIPLNADVGAPGTLPTEVTPPGVIIMKPSVFKVPAEQAAAHRRQCGVIMPFGGLFGEMYENDYVPAIKRAGFEPVRADEVWKDSVLINDVFQLIYQSRVVVADRTGRNANVLYVLGIAHTLGRIVVPLVQDADDIPFDLRHHRYLRYEPTTDGRQVLQKKLRTRLVEVRKEERLASSS